MQFNRIVMHHTGGPYTATTTDLRAYHTITQGDGSTVPGRFPYEANAIGTFLRSGHYAAHTARLNTGAIGKAVAAMGNGVWSRPRDGKFFPTSAQMHAFLVSVAKDAKKYGIPVTRENILSHAEVEITLGVKQANKWDFDYDPFGLSDLRDPIEIGDMLRGRIKAFMLNVPEVITQDQTPVILESTRPVLRQGATGAYVRELQTLLNAHRHRVDVDGIFGPATRAVLISFQHNKQLVKDGVVGRATWAALGV